MKDIEKVLTCSEAARIYYIKADTLKKRLQRGVSFIYGIDCRKPKGERSEWLVTVEAMNREYNSPFELVNYLIDLDKQNKLPIKRFNLLSKLSVSEMSYKIQLDKNNKALDTKYIIKHIKKNDDIFIDLKERSDTEA
jgi:hypothetical protein